ncbi:MAG TPA: translocation/assembly module TamB domain-containing protein [Gemmatimonadales bacterium]
MVRRSLGVALWSLVGLLACFLGALSALVGTGAGRRLLSRAMEGSLARSVAGTIQVGDMRGTLLTGVTLTDVRVFAADTSLVAWLPRAELSYNPFDLAAGRIVLLELRLDRPLLNLVQNKGGRLNLEELLRLGGPDSGPKKPPALVAFRNVEIEDGSLVLRLLDRESPGDSLLEIELAAGGERRRVRRFERLDARLVSLRLSSPRERGVLAEIQQLAVVISDPGVELTDVRGRLLVMGDSLDVDFERVALPGSSLAARGRLRWPRDTLLYDLDLVADSATLSDFRFIDQRFPPGAVLAGGIDLHSRGSRVLEIRLDPLDLRYRGGSLEGRVTAVSSAGVGLVALRQGDLVATEFDLEFARPFLDTLPFAGRLTGRTVTDGRLSELAMEIDWAFRDSLVEGWPVTEIRGRGAVDLEAAEGLSFRAFAVDQAEVDLATVHRLIPAFLLEGTLDAAGTLDGPYRNAQFSGTLRHRDPGGPPSVVRGVVRLDSRRDPLGVFADVFADSVSFDGLRGSFPELPLAGVAGGTIQLQGSVERLETHADLSMPRGGRVRGDGVLVVDAPRYGTRDFTLRAEDLNLARWFERGPPSRLSFVVEGTADLDSSGARGGRLTARLQPSLLAGVVLDSGVAGVRFDETRLYVDSLHLVQTGLTVVGGGALGWDRRAAGTLRFTLDADSLASLDSLVAWAVKRAPGDAAIEAPRGAARVVASLTGSFDSLDVEARADVRNLRWNGWHVPLGRAELEWHPGPASTIDIAVGLDSVARDGLGFAQAEITLGGRPDSLVWFARSRVGELAAFLGGGRFARRSGGRRGAIVLGVDSLAVLLPGSIWFLEGPTELLASDSLTRVANLRLISSRGPGRIGIDGHLPLRGRGSANIQLESVPLPGIYALLQRDTAGIGGYVTATMGIEGSRVEPVYHGSFALSDGSFGKFRTPFLDGRVEYANRRLDGALNLWRSGQQILTVTADLPIDLALTTVPRRRLPDTLAVTALADSVDLSLLEALTPMVRDVRGGFSTDLGIRGTWDAPRLSGGVRIANAEAFIPALNVRYEGITGRLTMSGDSIRVDSLRVRGGQGSADVGGAIRLQQLGRPTLALRIDAREFRALDLRGFLSVTASGRLALDGPVFGATLTGRGTVTSGQWYFADLVRKRVIDIDAPWAATLIDTSLAATIRRQRLGPEFESVFLDSLRIRDLDLAMGSDVWLRSNEANIQLTGTARVNKETGYRLTGTLQAPRGVYRLTVGPVTREFTVTQGTVRYFGTPDLDAELDIEARHVVHPLSTAGATPEDITVIARIRGTLLVPQLTLEAEGRELAQSEIISYLLFGQPTVDQADQGLVRSALASLYGEFERAIVSDLGVPLDYLEIRPIDPSNPRQGIRFAAGWQVGDKTFLVVKGGFCEGDQQRNTRSSTIGVGLQFRLSPEWRAEASVEPPLECGVARPLLRETQQVGFDLFWERRY